jgi:signal transduction histidine kinase
METNYESFHMDISTQTYASLTDIAKIHAALIKLLIPLTSNEVYREVVHQAVALASGKYGTIFFYDKKKAAFQRAYSSVPEDQQFHPRPKGNTFWAYTYNRPKFVTRKTLESAHPNISPKVHSLILIPLSFQKKRLGVLSLQSDSEIPFSTKHKESLLLFGSIASLAIRKAQLHEQKEQALETRDLFMSAASHELKTPLSSIRAYAQLIQQKMRANKLVSDKSVTAIIRNADRLTDMINSLFMASQVSAGTFASFPETFDLYAATRQYVTDIKITTNRTFIFSGNTKSIPFYGDKSQWYTVVTNLMRNAESYSPKHTPIAVSLRVVGSTVIFKVSNEGKGIRKEDIKRIFEKYFRSKQQKAGLGLGLFLCHQIVKAHHGTITIESKPNIQTTVTVRFPLNDDN